MSDNSASDFGITIYPPVTFDGARWQGWSHAPTPTRKVVDVRIIDSTADTHTLQVTCDDGTVFTGTCGKDSPGKVDWDDDRQILDQTFEKVPEDVVKSWGVPDHIDDPMFTSEQIDGLSTNRWLTRLERKHL